MNDKYEKWRANLKCVRSNLSVCIFKVKRKSYRLKKQSWNERALDLTTFLHVLSIQIMWNPIVVRKWKYAKKGRWPNAALWRNISHAFEKKMRVFFLLHVTASCQQSFSVDIEWGMQHSFLIQSSPHLNCGLQFDQFSLTCFSFHEFL